MSSKNGYPTTLKLVIQIHLILAMVYMAIQSLICTELII